MNVLVVGAGAMGQWFARSIDASITFTDTNPTTAQQAADTLDGQVSPVDGDDQFEVVCVAVPMTVTESVIAEQAHRATDAILDLSGVMVGPTNAMASHAPHQEQVSLHPLFAPENAPGQIAMVANQPGPHTDSICNDLKAQGNTLFETTPPEHDHAMITVQAKAHAAILAFALTADPVPEEFGTPVYDGLVSLVEMLTDGSPRVYADIQTVFEGATEVADAARQIADADPETFATLYRNASK